jgi:hypothetical protein
MAVGREITTPAKTIRQIRFLSAMEQNKKGGHCWPPS